ncbi:cyclin-P [Pseudophryne corroboree]|uniref:cyclin-P n=1 Tax=Pseudophryne corroboree TaxID=495146 RepID=UPI0030817EEE
MDGKREPFKTKDNNQILCKREDKKLCECETEETGYKREDKKKKSLFLCSKPSVTDKVVTSVINSISRKGPFILESWEEDLAQSILELEMHVEQEYAIDIFKCMMKNQWKYVFRVDDIPKSVTTEMRSMLVDWLVQVHEYLGLQEETLYLAVYLMNSYMKAHSIRTYLLQLLAASCLFIACKMEETLIPEPAELCFMMEDSFSKKELMKMEKKVLSGLRFELQYTQPLHFLRLLSVTGKCLEKVQYLAMYFMELTLLEADGAMIEPALLAAGALTLAQKVSLESGSLSPDQMWHGALYTYSDTELTSPQYLMAKAALRANTDSKSTWQKYSRPQQLGVSTGTAMANSKHLARCLGFLCPNTG